MRPIIRTISLHRLIKTAIHASSAINNTWEHLLILSGVERNGGWFLVSLSQSPHPITHSPTAPHRSVEIRWCLILMSKWLLPEAIFGAECAVLWCYSQALRVQASSLYIYICIACCKNVPLMPCFLSHRCVTSRIKCTRQHKQTARRHGKVKAEIFFSSPVQERQFWIAVSRRCGNRKGVIWCDAKRD